MKADLTDQGLIIALKGRVDTTNVNSIEEEIVGVLEEHPEAAVILDAEELE